MSAGKRIRQLRDDFKVSQKELSRDLGYKTYTTVSKWESGASLPPGKELTKLATYFNVSTDYILGLDTIKKINHSDDFSNTVQLDYIKPKTQVYIEENIIRGKIDVPRHLIDKEPGDYFVASIQTEVMNRVIPSGNKIIALDYTKIKNPSIKSEDIIIVRKNNLYKMRFYRKSASEILLEPSSHDQSFDTETYSLKEFESLEIVGKVIYTFRDFLI